MRAIVLLLTVEYTTLRNWAVSPTILNDLTLSGCSRIYVCNKNKLFIKLFLHPKNTALDNTTN
jgi:hypothetical protein